MPSLLACIAMGARLAVEHLAGLGHERIDGGRDNRLIQAQLGLADLAPGLLKTLREHDPDFVLLDGTLAECDRVGDSRAAYSAKHRRHGVNVQVVTDPVGGTGTRRTWHGRLKFWQIFRRSRISPNRMTVIAKAVLTLERHR